MSAIEVRIHGVSGTPPDAMLATDPVIIEQRAGGDIVVYRPPATRTDLRAYRWSSLTSGSWKAAFWIALLPFMLCNVAGFALPQMSERRHRLGIALVRLAGMALTMVFALVTAQGFIDAGAYQYLHVSRRLLEATVAVALGALAAAGFMILLWVKLSRAGRPDGPAMGGDPTTLRLGDREMWSHFRIEEDLRSVHLGVALAAVGWVTYDVLSGLEASIPGLVAVVWRWLIPGGLAVTMTVVVGGRTGRWVGGIPLVVGMTLVWLVVAGALVDAGVDPGDLTLAQMEMSLTVAVLTILIVALTAVTLAPGRTGSGVAAPALLTMAGASGASVGAALIHMSVSATGGVAPHWIGNLAVGYLTGLLIVTDVILILAVSLTSAGAEPAMVRLFTALRRIRHRLHLVLVAVLVSTAVITAGFVGGRFGLWEFSIPEEVPISLAVVGLVTLAVWCLRLRARRLALGVVVGSVVVTGMAGRGLLDRDGVFGWSFAGYQATAVTVTVVLPLLLIGGRMIGALRDKDQRRGLAVAWDVGSFFPRRYHPFAPPGYGAQAVTDLADYLTRERAGEAAVIVAPHSQGTVVAVAALALLDDLGGDIALLTYGSPVGSLYRRFFPNLFDDIAGRLEGLEDRWINLFRCDDPIAGPIGGKMDAPPLPDPHRRVHGGYWLEPEYEAAINRMHDLIGSR